MSVPSWLDLGDQSQACIVKPETCGTQGGTLSVWYRVLDFQEYSAVIGNVFDKGQVYQSIWQDQMHGKASLVFYNIWGMQSKRVFNCVCQSCQMHC